MSAVAEKIVSLEEFKVLDGKLKLNKDGSIRQTRNNQTEDRWVDPIKSKEDVKRIIRYLAECADKKYQRMDTQFAAYRNEMLFIIGINVGLRVSDLVSLKWENIFENDMETFKDDSRKREQKTGKIKDICVNSAMQSAVLKYLERTGIKPVKGEYIFLSAKRNKDGKYNKITDAAVEKMINHVTAVVGVRGNFGTHSLRKTYAWHKFMMYESQGDPLALVKVQKDLNHRNSSDTARYLGITRMEKIKSSLDLGDYWDM